MHHPVTRRALIASAAQLAAGAALAQSHPAQVLLGAAAAPLPPATPQPRALIIDTDPGQDDAIALLMALAAPDRLEVRGLTVSVGNLPLTVTEKNTRIVRDWAGRPDVPVYAGYPRPLVREPIFAADVHGKTGMDGPVLHEPRAPLMPIPAVTWLIETLRAAEPGSITLAGLGPLTNIAAALNMAPEIKPAIREIVVLGGSWGVGGNITPAATFNFYADPEAASVVFRSGVPVTAVAHDAARRVLVTPERIAPIRQLGNQAGRVVADILDNAMEYAVRRRGVAVGPMYDPCAIAYLLRPEIFKGVRVPVDIETRGEFTTGATVVDFRGYTRRKPNALWISEVDIEAFYALLQSQLARLP
ncbi:nucleoside hydrolase [Variovorax sp.]|uniref:nucleoside hydrolase n=1 Tax=Variovorax sp. TaxID=1871043 RepID=UPI002D358269|nr:nucleoside hydrolase [Variovorax sp.]HYP84310.1 nucleoside hydrolase [Variovorax sp.]